jgi:hypothetical protein
MTAATDRPPRAELHFAAVLLLNATASGGVISGVGPFLDGLARAGYLGGNVARMAPVYTGGFEIMTAGSVALAQLLPVVGERGGGSNVAVASVGVCRASVSAHCVGRVSDGSGLGGSRDARSASGQRYLTPGALRCAEGPRRLALGGLAISCIGNLVLAFAPRNGRGATADDGDDGGYVDDGVGGVRLELGISPQVWLTLGYGAVGVGGNGLFLASFPLCRWFPERVGQTTAMLSST